MSYQFLPYALLLSTSTVASLFTVAFAWPRRKVPGAVPFIVLMFASTPWSTSNAPEMMGLDLSTKLFWADVQYVCYNTIAVGWFVMALYYAGQGSWRNRRRLALLLIIPVATVLRPERVAEFNPAAVDLFGAEFASAFDELPVHGTAGSFETRFWPIRDGLRRTKGHAAEAGMTQVIGEAPQPGLLLVDDHSLFLDGLRNVLDGKGFRILDKARNGWEAIEKTGIFRPDLVLMDVQMPECDGLMATRLPVAERPTPATGARTEARRGSRASLP